MTERFAIATIPVPSSGKVGIAPLPGRAGDLAADIEEIRRWQAQHVVSLVQTPELQQFQVGNIGYAMGTQAITWRHLPVADFGVPDQQATAEWAQISETLHAALSARENVLLHCMGGKGRSGMIALRLMIERGEDPSRALARIRAVRPGAVETEAQWQWAIAGKPRVQTNPTTDLAR
jgi:protein-tyrosine phosphatase